MSKIRNIEEWQKGDNCKLKPEERAYQHKVWLETLHKEFRPTIQIVESNSYLTEEQLEKERK